MAGSCDVQGGGCCPLLHPVGGAGPPLCDRVGVVESWQLLQPAGGGYGGGRGEVGAIVMD